MPKPWIEKNAIAKDCFHKALEIEKATKYFRHHVDTDAYEMLLHQSSSLCACFHILTAPSPTYAALQMLRDANQTIRAIEAEARSNS